MNFFQNSEENQLKDALKSVDNCVKEHDPNQMTATLARPLSMNYSVFSDGGSSNSSAPSSFTSFSSLGTTSSLKRQESIRSARDFMNNCIHFSLYNPGEVSKRALQTELTNLFTSHVHTLTISRAIFCSAEYPMSFTGREAVDITRIISKNDWTRKEIRNMFRTHVQTIVPPFFLPVAYSERSLENNSFYDSPTEAYTLVEGRITNQAIYTQLLECYTPMCIRGYSSGCYAPTCPNIGKPLYSEGMMKELQRNISVTSSVPSSRYSYTTRSWSSSVPEEVLRNTPMSQIKHQEAIYELIYTEDDYVRDLNLLEELFAIPLQTAPCLYENKRNEFCQQVFGNYLTLIYLHRQMYRELRDHQFGCLEKGEHVKELAGILFGYIDQFKSLYTTYAENFVFAEYTARKEQSTNILFHNFIRTKELLPETRKLSFRHFLISPITRLQRYPLLLDAIRKRTTDALEKQRLAHCIGCIKNVAKQMDQLTLKAKENVRLREVNDMIYFKPGYVKIDLNLLDPKRKLVYEGPLKRRSKVDTVDLHVFLFDHMLVMTKPKESLTTHDVKSYAISRNPIPLNLLLVRDVICGSFLSTSNTSKGYPSIPANENCESHLVWLEHLGRHGGEYLLDTGASVNLKKKILTAQEEYQSTEYANQAMKITPVCTSTQSGLAHSFGRVYCASPMSDHRVVLGTQNGVWMGTENGMFPFRRVLSTPKASQLCILEKQNILLVLADKVLMAYSVAQLDPRQDIKKTNEKSYRILSSNCSYFNVGECNGRILVIAMKRKVADSHFKAFEPICGDLNNPKHSKLLTNKTSFMSKAPAWFRLYKEFYVGTDTFAVYFLKTKILVACSRKFEVLDLDYLDVNISFPNLQHPGYHFLNRSLEAKLLGIFRCNETTFLLCYDKFAFLMNSYGNLIKDKYEIIEWQSNPTSVAFSYPYVLAFDTKFIEIYHSGTGKLMQIIKGENTRHLASAMNNTNSIYCSALYEIKMNGQHNLFKLDP